MSSVRGLYIVPTDYSDLERKGVLQILQDRELESDFERLITVHPWANHTQVIDLTPKHRLIELQEYFLPGTQCIKLLRYPQHVVHIARILWTLVQTLYRERIQFVRAQDPVYSGLLAWLVTRLVHRPYGISIHADYDKRFELAQQQGAPTLFGSRRLAKTLEKLVLSNAQVVLPIRQTLADSVIRTGIAADKVRVIPHGIHLEDFIKPASISIAERFLIPTGRQILSFVGRLSKENYLSDVITLVERLAQIRSDFVVVIAGDGSERAELEKQIQDRHLSAFVKMIGFQPREVIIALRQASAVSLCLMGGFSLIEACAVGRPVIAYDVEWHSELVQTGQSGWLVPEHDMDALLHAVNECLSNPHEATRRGQVAQQLALERHDIRKTSELKKQVYQTFL